MFQDQLDDLGGLKMKDKTTFKPINKKKKGVLRKRSGAGKDISMFYNSYPPGATPDNLETYKVIIFEFLKLSIRMSNKVLKIYLSNLEFFHYFSRTST